MKKNLSRGLKLVLSLSLIFGVIIGNPKISIVNAIDTNIAEFNDIYIPVLNQYANFDKENVNYRIQATDIEMCVFTMLVHREAYTIKNIRYHRAEKILTYETEPASPKVSLTITRDWSKYLASGEYKSYWPGANVQFNNQMVVYGPSEYDYYEQSVGWDNAFRYFGNLANYGGIVDDRYVPIPETFSAHYTTPALNHLPLPLGENYQNSGLHGDPTKIRIIENYTDYTGIHIGVLLANFVKKDETYSLIKNNKPTLTLTSQNNATIQNEQGVNIYNVEGYAQDPDNDDLDVIVEIPNVYYRKVKVKSTLSGKYFNVPINAIEDSLSPGTYTVNVKVVDPYNVKAEASRSLNVKIRLKNKSFVLINDPVSISTKYSDYESDPQYALRYRYDHDPGFFDNSMGMIADSSLWRTTMYTSFQYSGVYTATVQAKDNPKNDNRFDLYRMWGRDNLSSMSYHVHRRPVALFSAKLINRSVQLADSSYDLDHTSAVNKGISQWQWQYKPSAAEVWTDGQPPATLPTSNAYEVRLRVRDIDGEGGIGVWSDWCRRTVGVPGNTPPVAMFIVDPALVSYRKATTITDKSFDPDNDLLDTYQWTVVKNGSQTVWSYSGAAKLPPNIASYGVGGYLLTLKVRDNRGLWSEPYTQNVTVMNHPPAAAFTMPSEVYRDTVIALENLTPDPDEDGDTLTYSWKAQLNGGSFYNVGTIRNQSLTIGRLIQTNGITLKKAISEGWEMLMTASDGSLSSNATRTFTVKNHIPTAAISGPATAAQFDTLQYRSADEDLDPSDVSSLKYYWKVTDSDGSTQYYSTKDIKVTFDDFGIHTLEHWAVDQIDGKSNVAVLKVNVTKNLAPSVTLTSPPGTAANPSVIDAQLQGDPLVQWTYSDPENDSQEKYLLEFYRKDGLLAKTVENADPTGSIRQYQIPNPTFERFVYFSLYGRAYSRGSWSEISNEKAFIIDNPPQPGFTLLTDTGRNAAQVPIYRTDVLNIQGTATDPDTVKGDNITYKYYLKPAGGTESLASAQGNFSKQFTTNGNFTLRQVVTDSLGLYRELSQTITVANRLPSVNITYPAGSSQTSPTIVNTITPVMKWEYQDEDGDLQQRYKVRIINLTTGAITVQSGEQVSSAKQWQIPAGSLVENQKYAVEAEVYDGFGWSSVSPRKYFMVNLLTVKGAVQHTAEWNENRKAYNLNKSGNPESPRGYNVFWAGEKFVLQANTTGMPSTVEVIMTGGYTVQLNPADSGKTLWTGELYNAAFEQMPEGPVAFTFTAKNEFNTKTDTVTVTIQGNWAEYFQSHRTK